jgi:ATP-dependent protease ClpP protease subunit
MNKNNVYVENDDDDVKNPLPLVVKQKYAYKSFEQTFTAHQIHFYITDDIGEPSDYVEMIHRILTASQNDVIFIHLNTAGGRLDTGIQIINAMQNSQAKIITVLESMAHSLGTLIFLAGDEMVVHDHCMMMFHNYRGGVIGKGHEQAAEINATTKWYTSIAKKIYIPFMTEEEVDRIMKGEDIWMHSPEIRRRLDKMIRDMETPKSEGIGKQTPTKKATRRQKQKPTKQPAVDNLSE